MLSDQQLEDVLRRYRVVDPPHNLGLAIASATKVEEAIFAWLCGPAVAAAVIVVWLGVQVAMLADPMDTARDAEVAFASEMLGGGQSAIDYARVVVPVPDDDEPTALLREEMWQRP